MSSTGAEDREQAAPAEPQTLRFEAEVDQLLHLVIHSLYSHKEIFLRELVSNASDALDKLKFRAITEPALLADDPALEIRIAPDAAAGTLTIEDTGVGMTRDELASNLGTIARSGSREFLEQLTKKNAEGAKDVSLIGQFGVGFYSAFLVADRVEVTSRAAGHEGAWRWTSDAKGSFTIAPAERASRGTSVVLHVKPDQKDFLEEWRLRELVARYSDYVGYPIKLLSTPRGPDGDVTSGAAPEWQAINKASALWQRPKGEITDEQYDDFYKHLTHDYEAPLGRTHFRVEGSQQFVGLLFIPRHAPFELDWHQKRKGVRLFVRRVFIMDDADELLPQWLRFVRGVVDSDDLPLNVSRELLQDSAVARSIRKQLVKRTLDALDEMARDRPDDYATFQEAFGAVLKEGLTIDRDQRDRLGALVRYESSKSEPGKRVSLDEYVARMPEGQPAIYYVVGESRALLEGSPHLESLRKRGYEVLYMTDPVDEWATEGLGEFKGRKLVAATRADLPLDAKTDDKPEDKTAREEREASIRPLLDKARAVLGDRVRDVRASARLTDSPCCLVVPEGATGAYVERLLREHGRAAPHAKRTLELNPEHPLVLSLRTLAVREPESTQLADWIELLFDQALLTEGDRIGDPNRFAQRLTALLSHAAKEAAG